MTRESYEVIEELREQIGRQDALTEGDCGIHLAKIAWILLPKGGVQFVYLDQEKQTTTGRVDMTIIAEERRPIGDFCRVAFVWELKAPQLSPFEMETKERAQPTAEFYKAENQLLHYKHDLAKNGHFLESWKILSGDFVRYGGIIMGRRDNFCAHIGEDARIKSVVNQTWAIRQRAFYQHNSITLWTWDDVLEYAELGIESHQRRAGDPHATMDLKTPQAVVISVSQDAP